MRLAPQKEGLMKQVIDLLITFSFMQVNRYGRQNIQTISLKCKQWTISGQKPSPALSDNGLCLLIGGFGWFPEVELTTCVLDISLHLASLKLSCVVGGVAGWLENPILMKSQSS